MDRLKTCRFCGMSNYEHKHPAARSAWVQYSARHSAHLKCAIEKQGVAFLEKLGTHKLERLPYFEIEELGIGEWFRAEMKKRGAL